MTAPLRRLVGAVLLACALVPGLATSPPGAAAARAAQTCPPLDLEDGPSVVARAEKVDDVFVGRVLHVVRHKRAGKPALVLHRVEVIKALSGDVGLGDKVTVQFTRSGARNRVLGKRETHLFFTTDAAGKLRADYCTGSQELTDGLSASLQRTLEGYLEDGVAEPPTRVELHQPDGGSGEPPRLSRVVAPGAAVSLIGVLGLMLVARIGRRRA